MARSPLHVGTCGFSCPEWIEAGIYPPGTRPAAMLGLYSRMFAVVELNYTWYQMIRAETVTRMLAGSDPALLFCAKLTRTMTHEIAADWRKQALLYRQGIQPLTASGRLVAVLVQLPPSFRRTPEQRRYLAHLFDTLHPLPLAVEFRHRSWAQDSVFQGLEQRHITLVSVDAPPLPDLFPTLDLVTNPDLFYLRLHGRNRIGWCSGSRQQQFDYNYSDHELAEWSRERIPKMPAGTGVILFNNHVAGQAVRNARTMIRQLA
jgi:uncharacterized protein YecE (DUF72 family)